MIFIPSVIPIRASLPRLLIAAALLIGALLPTLGAGGTGTGDDPFRIDDKTPTIGYVTRSSEPVPQDLIGIPMIARVAGVLGTIEAGSFAALRRGMLREAIEPASLSGATLVGHLHLLRDETSREYEIHAISEQTMALRSMEDSGRVWGVSRAAMDRLGIRWASPSAEHVLHDGGTRFELAHPHLESPTVLDRRTLAARIKAGYPALTRTIDHETFRVRLPDPYDPRHPAGVLVWISPGESGRIPEIFEPILDKLGLIAVGVDGNGNTREITDRLQNHLDSIETLGASCLIDPSRIYLSGMSGGGRCAGILQLAFPDIFAGAVPVVGLDTYHNAPTGEPGKFWPARLGKPAGRWMRLLKDRRIAAISGTADFNLPEIKVRKAMLESDGIDMRLDIIEGMSHAMPTAEQFASALGWVDQPRRDANAEALADAANMMDRYRAQSGDSAPTDPAARRRLIEIIELAPYSGSAWEASALLGYPESD